MIPQRLSVQYLPYNIYKVGHGGKRTRIPAGNGGTEDETTVAPRRAEKGSKMKCLLWLIVFGLLAAAPCSAGELQKYTDPDQQTKVWFGARSHWAQPWRAYLETVPATTFLNGTGINYNNQGDPDIRIQHLARHGFAHIRLEIGWGSVNDNDETRLTNGPVLRPILVACRKWHVRPLILLNAHQGVPCPVLVFRTNFDGGGSQRRPAGHAGQRGGSCRRPQRAIALDGLLGRPGAHHGHSGQHRHPVHAAAQRHPRRNPRPDGDPPVPPLLAARTATTTKPRSPAGCAMWTPSPTSSAMPWALRGKRTPALIWKSGTNSPSAVTSCTSTDYYDPPLVKYADTGVWVNLRPRRRRPTWRRTGTCTRAFRSATASPTPSPGPPRPQQPPGVSAIDKHPYAGRITFPDPKARQDIVPLNALLEPDTTHWEPSYMSLFPEYFASAIQTETMVREMSPARHRSLPRQTWPIRPHPARLGVDHGTQHRPQRGRAENRRRRRPVSEGQDDGALLHVLPEQRGHADDAVQRRRRRRHGAGDWKATPSSPTPRRRGRRTPMRTAA